MECPICLDEFRSPKILPCQHTYCKECLEDLIRRNSSGKVKCSECNAEHEVPREGFPTNVTYQRLVNRNGNKQAEQKPNVVGRYALTCLRVARKAIRTVVSSFLHRYKKRMIVTVVIFLIITLTRFIAGAVKIKSVCSKERMVAIYLLVKACFGFVFWIAVLLIGISKQLSDVMDNLFIEVYVVIDSLFSIIWFSLGIFWIIKNYDAMTIECHVVVADWNKHFINFAYFLLILDIIFLVAFIFYSLYVTCDKSNRVTTEKT